MGSKSKGIVPFVIIAFAITWGSFYAIYLLGHISIHASKRNYSSIVQLLSLLGTFGPAIASVIVRKWITNEGFKDAGLGFNFKTGWVYYFWAILGPLAAATIALAITIVVKADVVGLGIHYPIEVVGWFLSSIVFTIRFFGEEFGWRGYLQPRLSRGRPLTGSLLTGLIWGIWYYAYSLPDIYFMNPMTLPLYPIYFAALSVFLGWLRTKSSSVWPASLANAFGTVFVLNAIVAFAPHVSAILSLAFLTLGYAVVAIVLVLGHHVRLYEAITENASE